jgi:hypothetical protein
MKTHNPQVDSLLLLSVDLVDRTTGQAGNLIKEIVNLLEAQ